MSASYSQPGSRGFAGSGDIPSSPRGSRRERLDPSLRLQAGVCRQNPPQAAGDRPKGSLRFHANPCHSLDANFRAIAANLCSTNYGGFQGAVMDKTTKDSSLLHCWAVTHQKPGWATHSNATEHPHHLHHSFLQAGLSLCPGQAGFSVSLNLVRFGAF